MKRVIPMLLVTACASEGDSPTDTDTDGSTVRTTEDRVATFETRGTWAVGYDETTVTYDDPTGEGTRTNRVAIWYPTNDNPGAVVSFTGPLAPTDVRDAPALPDGRFPLAVFSHGHQGDTDNASHLMTWFASHGWVAIAPEHTGNTLADGSDRTTEIYIQRAFDITTAIDAFTTGDAAPWTSIVDAERIFGFGHSFGGYTMFGLAGASWDTPYWDAECDDSDDAFCSTWSDDLVTLMDAGVAEPRIDAFATLSGGNWGQYRESGFGTVGETPLLLVSGALDSSVSNEGNSDPIWRDLSPGGKVRVDFAHGDHQTYTDFAGTGGGIIPGTSPDAIAAEDGWRALYIYLGAFAATHVLDDDEALAPILDGTYAIESDVTLSVK